MTGQERPKPSLLLVDDEPEILFSLKGLLRREFELHTAESGQEALEILQQHPIQVIMTDQRMPEMTGVELMGQVKQSHPDAVRIVFTGYADIKAVVEAINSGGLFRYITKPWDPDELIKILREATAEYSAMVRGRQLLADLQHHLEVGQQLASQRVSQEADSAASEWNGFIQGGAELLTRLEQERSTEL